MVSWKLSNTLEGRFCVEAFKEAVNRAGRVPSIFKTDQGSQFTSEAWTGMLESAGVRVSMDGKGRWLDNAFIESLWRSVKREGVYLWAPTTCRSWSGCWGSGFRITTNSSPTKPWAD